MGLCDSYTQGGGAIEFHVTHQVTGALAQFSDTFVTNVLLKHFIEICGRTPTHASLGERAHTPAIFLKKECKSKGGKFPPVLSGQRKYNGVQIIRGFFGAGRKLKHVHKSPRFL